MRVNQGGTDVTVAQQFLHRANVGSGLKQMCCERMTQRMNRYRFANARQRHGLLQAPLHPVFIQMMAPLHPTARIDGQRGRREQPEPRPGVAYLGTLAV